MQGMSAEHVERGCVFCFAFALLLLCFCFASAVLCIALLRIALLCCALLCIAFWEVFCFALLCFALLCYALLCFAFLCVLRSKKTLSRFPFRVKRGRPSHTLQSWKAWNPNFLSAIFLQEIWLSQQFWLTQWTNGEANISDMEIYAVSNKWVKISDFHWPWHYQPTLYSKEQQTRLQVHIWNSC